MDRSSDLVKTTGLMMPYPCGHPPRLLRTIRKQIGEHPSTLEARGNLAYWTGQAGDPAGARDQFASLLPVDERALGPQHPETRAVRNNLAHLNKMAGDSGTSGIAPESAV
jgi:hypothetical protein